MSTTLVAGHDFDRHDNLLYKLDLIDNWGNIYPVSLLCIEKIVSNPGNIDVGISYEAFPHVPAQQALDHPHGEVGLLNGQDNTTLVPLARDVPNLSGQPEGHENQVWL